MRWSSKWSKVVQAQGQMFLTFKATRNRNLREEKSQLRPFASMASDAVDLSCFLTKSFINLDKIDENIYRSIISWRPKLSRGIYGGLIMGQALMAAAKTEHGDFHAHSFHCYFLRRGNAAKPVIYTVDRTNEGRTFSNRMVKATQEGGAIFTMLASFKREETDPFSHQLTMPKVPDPEGLMCAKDLVREALNPGGNLDATTALASLVLEDEFPCEFRPVNPQDFIHYQEFTPRRLMWMRAVGHIGDNMNMHKCAAAYMSDMFLIDVARLPGPKHPPKFLTSLDQSTWFHQPFCANEWMLFESESPQAGGGRGLALGRMWRRDGVLAISVAQEGIVRTMDYGGKL